MTDRNNKGQFLPGNKASPGRPKAAVDKAYLDVLKTNVTLEDWQEIITKIVSMAKDGNFWAIRWLSDYLIGKPDQTLNVNTDQPMRVVQLVFSKDVDDNSGHSAE